MKFDYKPPKSNWDKYLDNNSNYNSQDKIKIRTLKGYTDIILGRLNKNNYYEMSKERASYLEAKGLVEIC